MRRPLQALLIVPDVKMRRAVLEGTKRISIREGHRDYRPGPLVLCCHLEPWAVMVEVTSVRHCMLAEITIEECRDEGFSSRSELLYFLRRFYPDMLSQSPITVIRWENAAGKLVDKHNAQKAFREAERSARPPRIS